MNDKLAVIGMYYRLQSDYALRGWKKRTCNLLSLKQKIVKPLAEEEFRFLLFCDGETDLEEFLFSEEMLSAKEKFLSQGVITELETPAPIDEKQRYRYFDNRFVESVQWSITGRCNFRCRHCYMDAPDGVLGEPTTEEALDLIGQMADCGIYHVSLTGGEPLIRPDFWTIVDSLMAHEIRIDKIYTNGWLLDDTVLDQFDARGIRPDFSLSFDGVGWHDWMRGVKGAEEAALAALERCRKRGFLTDVEMCLHRGNRTTIAETVEKLASLDVGSLKIGIVEETDLWKHHCEDKVYSFREYLEDCLQYIPTFFEQKMPMNLILGTVIVLKQGSTEYKIVPENYDGCGNCLDQPLCGSARLNCYISPELRLVPCMPMLSSPDQSWFPKIGEIGLKKGLSDSNYMEFISRKVGELFAVNEKCNACAHKLYCGGGCRATAFLEGEKHLMGCDENQCILWNEGYVDRIRRTAEASVTGKVSWQ